MANELMGAVLQYSKVLHIRESIQRLVRERPDVTVTEVLELLDSLVDEAAKRVQKYTDAVDIATCRFCGKPIERLHSEEPWTHTDRDRSRGCRAATFTMEDGWDESVPRSWRAAPES